MKAFLEKYLALIAAAGTLGVLLVAGWGANAYLGATYATHSELYAVKAESKCGDIQYQIDKIQQKMWAIEDRNVDSQGNARRMGSNDSRTYRKLVKFLAGWENEFKKWGCEPPKDGT